MEPAYTPSLLQPSQMHAAHFSCLAFCCRATPASESTAYIRWSYMSVGPMSVGHVCPLPPLSTRTLLSGKGGEVSTRCSTRTQTW
jgi:hypothetical protein